MVMVIPWYIGKIGTTRRYRRAKLGEMAVKFPESKLSDEMVAICRKVANCPQQLVDWPVTEDLASQADLGGIMKDSCYEPVARHRVVAHQAQVRSGARVVALPYQHGARGEHLDRPCPN